MSDQITSAVFIVIHSLRKKRIKSANLTHASFYFFILLKCDLSFGFGKTDFHDRTRLVG
jgi:hypothetical protein